MKMPYLFSKPQLIKEEQNQPGNSEDHSEQLNPFQKEK